MNPSICVLIDAGTKPGGRSIYHLWKAFELNPSCGGACGEIKAMLGTGWKHLRNPLVATQNFEYKVRTALGKEDLFCSDAKKIYRCQTFWTSLWRVCLVSSASCQVHFLHTDSPLCKLGSPVTQEIQSKARLRNISKAKLCMVPMLDFSTPTCILPRIVSCVLNW